MSTTLTSLILRGHDLRVLDPALVPGPLHDTHDPLNESLDVLNTIPSADLGEVEHESAWTSEAS